MFLIVGVEIYCKIRGAFVSENSDRGNVDKVQAIHSRLGIFFQVCNNGILPFSKLHPLWSDIQIKHEDGTYTSIIVGPDLAARHIHYFRSRWRSENRIKCYFSVGI